MPEVRSLKPHAWPGKVARLLNDAPQKNAPASLDVDLGFTPATNLIAIRRLNLAIGAKASAPAAWLQLPDLRLGELPQFYRRKSATEYAYRAPSVGYSDVLKVSENGFVTDYPGLWIAEAVVGH